MPPIGPAAVRARAVDELLRDLGPRLRRGEAPGDVRRAWPTGSEALDHLLGGGVPAGGLTEVVGPPSSGHTSLALALLAAATQAEERVGWIDAANAFDPASAEAAGVRLERLLWVGAPGAAEALRAASLLLEAGGFAIVVLDRVGVEIAPPRAAWTRLARAAAASRTALVLLGSERLADASVDVVLEMPRARARFTGSPALVDALEAEVVLARHRAVPCGGRARLRLRAAG